MITVPANDVRIPVAAREALARHEAVMVLSHGRPAYVILSPYAYDSGRRPPEAPIPLGRRLRDALAFLATAPRPDPDFADDLEAIRASAGDTPPYRRERS
jgi:hypothetical protein